MSKELTTEEYYNKLWLENKELIQENIDRLNKKRFAQVLMLAEKDKEIERLNKCYCERTDCSGRIKNSKKYESMQEEIERLNNLLKETSQTLSEQTTKAITLKSENERLKNDIKRIIEINNQKIKIINDIIEYMNTNVNANINHIYEILEGDKDE